MSSNVNIWDNSKKHYYVNIIITSSNENIFRVTGHLCGEFTGHRWIPCTKASDAELWVFFIYAGINDWVNNGGAGDLRRHRAHYDVTVMIAPEICRESCMDWSGALQWTHKSSFRIETGCPCLIVEYMLQEVKRRLRVVKPSRHWLHNLTKTHLDLPCVMKDSQPSESRMQ